MIVTFVVTVWGWRAAFVLPVMIALLAIYVRLLSPESPVLGPDAGPQAAHRRNWIIQPIAYNTKPTN